MHSTAYRTPEFCVIIWVKTATMASGSVYTSVSEQHISYSLDLTSPLEGDAPPRAHFGARDVDSEVKGY